VLCGLRFAQASAVALLLGGTANAHPLLESASPKPAAVLTASPTQIRIGFSEGLVLAFSGIEIDNAAGKAVAAGRASLDASDSRELIAPLATKLGPGTYVVKWHAVGDDTHRVSGHYSFEVKR
jgi:methionine-rich copper-binding protein CopC